MSDAQHGQRPKPPQSPFGKFQTVGLLAAVLVAVVIALPFATREGSVGDGGGNPAPIPTVEEDPGGSGDGGGGGGGDGAPEPEETPGAEPTPGSASLAREDCVASGVDASTCESMAQDPAAADAYLACRDTGLTALECLGAPSSEGTTEPPPEESPEPPPEEEPEIIIPPDDG